MEKLISINLIAPIKGTSDFKNLNYLINKYSHPIIYYWNGEGNYLDSIIHDIKFNDFILNNFLNVKYYDNVSVASVFIDENLKYIENTTYIQDIIPLENCDSDFFYEYFIKTLKELFKNVYKVDYDESIKEGIYDIEYSYEETIKDIYNKIIHGVKRELSEDTITNYIRKTLQEDTSLNKPNIEFIINKINTIIKEKES